MTTAAVGLALLAALVAAPAAPGYGWPIRPFEQPHPVRGTFGEPRTVYREPLELRPHLARARPDGAFAFHDGVDISAAAGTPVYPVVSGRVRAVRGRRVVVAAADGRFFHYAHVVPSVRAGQIAVARRTMLGRVEQFYDHVHLAEVAGGRAVDPLLPGRLSPYEDTTPPRVSRITVRSPSGATLSPGAVRGRIVPVVDASDTPVLASPGRWDRLPVTPAVIRWSLIGPAGRVAVMRTAVDFRRGLPPNRWFWRVYARGSYQNRPRFGPRQHWLGGRYLFRLVAEPFPTGRLADGAYVLRVTATDVAGNRATRTQVVEIRNRAR
jgi:hypothetical protein